MGDNQVVANISLDPEDRPRSIQHQRAGLPLQSDRQLTDTLRGVYRRSFKVDHPGDYATINSYQLPYGTYQG